ncbi:hypothetical protein QJS10_CPA10g01076 [Acorus calamus]|uniref:APO domain-containing protein n=1 Tax=Acorus calamus TaxID=4465 RepID=A0AAV9DYZ4_ACOCL|nr:hypothetical protein QJS10_CPA10g01076 [Acorus calamus]
MRAFFSTTTVNPSFPSNPKNPSRKPLLTSVNDLKRQARSERLRRREPTENPLRPPENGLLVQSLIPIAHQVFDARSRLFRCGSFVSETVPIHRCVSCGDVHVGRAPHRIRTCGGGGGGEHEWGRGGVRDVLPEVESFHLYDRVGRAVSHEERVRVDRVPAVVELCVQAGVDVEEYPTRRRRFPVYSVAGKVIDFERRFPKDGSGGSGIEVFGFWRKRGEAVEEEEVDDLVLGDVQDAAKQGMEAWEKMHSGAQKLMQKYKVLTCGYCPEVQVGPKGHRVRLCQAYKHQMRDGQHAWQEATIDDLVPPVYVWHTRDPSEGPLVDCLKSYYGRLPAAVELFFQGGAPVGEGYTDVMRGDIVVPSLDEEKWVA